jgi:hypothetical protein
LPLGSSRAQKYDRLGFSRSHFAVWVVFIVVRAPIPAASFHEYDRARAQRMAEARRESGMVMSVVTDRPLIIAQRPISSWGDVSMHVALLANLPAAICTFATALALDQWASVPSLVESYLVAAVLLLASTFQWLAIGWVVGVARKGFSAGAA